jgi:hypothetical protein
VRTEVTSAKDAAASANAIAASAEDAAASARAEAASAIDEAASAKAALITVQTQRQEIATRLAEVRKMYVLDSQNLSSHALRCY